MSMTDEGTRPPNEPASSEKPENASSGNNAGGHPAQGLPGLAGFGQVQGYAPVTEQPQQAEAPYEPVEEPEPEIPAELPADHYDHSYSQDYSHEPQVYAEPIEPDAGIDDTGAGSSFVSDDVHSYMEEQHESHDDALNTTPASEYEAGAELHPDEAYHGEAGNTLQTFEAHYDQHPEIPLGAFEGPGEPLGDQPFTHEPGQTGDAEFMGGESAPEVAAPKERRVRNILMASSGLIGVLALGGALAFAYKIGGDSDIASTGNPPLIQADSRPVKVAPAKPGGKQFPHKNKKIYERLQGEKSQEVERLVPRQEDVAAAATTALATSQTPTGAQAQKSPAPGGKTSSAGAPRKVKTLTVRPDGTLEAASPRQKVVKAPPAKAAPQGSAPDGTVSMSFPQPLPSKPPVTASVPAPATAPAPVPAPVLAPAVKAVTPGAPVPVGATPPPLQKPPVPSAVTPAPAPQQIAAAPASAPAISGGKYVVQVAARKSQTDALAAFADIQQKYPRLLSGYRPIIKRADLGSKGVWYRLNVGPVASKKVASSLCGSLKGAGMRSCIVHSQ